MKLTRNEMCAFRPNKGACKGDSGGPLVCATDGGATLHGIVSRGSGELGCAGAASVFVDVFEFVDQILQHLSVFLQDEQIYINQHALGQLLRSFYSKYH